MELALIERLAPCRRALLVGAGGRIRHRVRRAALQLDAVARRCLYLQELLTTYTRQDVERVIGSLRERITPEPWREIPL